jgi:hypothetical protein
MLSPRRLCFWVGAEGKGIIQSGAASNLGDAGKVAGVTVESGGTLSGKPCPSLA